ncbi:hypothetical protein HDU97_000992 [Phlyctochytrium planicorne]|nr:hypothetical protein HDU97_000992 [Phlyctochytrium planicorne]
MPNNTKKKISKIKGAEKAHPHSRKAVQLRRALARDERIIKQKGYKNQIQRAAVDRMVFFKFALQDDVKMATNELMHELVELYEEFPSFVLDSSLMVENLNPDAFQYRSRYITRNDDEIKELQDAQRPGKPKPARLLQLEQQKERDAYEYTVGFSIPNLLDPHIVNKIRQWNGDYNGLGEIKMTTVRSKESIDKEKLLKEQVEQAETKRAEKTLMENLVGMDTALMDSTTAVRVAVRIRPPPSSPLEAISSPASPQSPPISAWSDPTTPGTHCNVVVAASTPTTLTVMKATAPQPGIAAASAVAAEGQWEFDAVYGEESNQRFLFESEVSPLITWFMEGFNVTLLAYGQTGSGKTYSMGTDCNHIYTSPKSNRRESLTFASPLGSPSRTSSADTIGEIGGEDDAFDSDYHQEPVEREEMGILPRALESIFENIRSSTEDPSLSRSGSGSAAKHEVKVSYLELYNEEWVDLLKIPISGAGPKTAWGASPSTPSGNGATSASGTGTDPQIVIREDKDGKLQIVGATEMPVSSYEEAMRLLILGSRSRTTASTAMNDRSSRSHAIFTLTLKTTRQRRSLGSPSRRLAAPTKKVDSPGPAVGGWMTVSSKFHFVDLAGSERLKRTKNTGDRKAEGIAINQGLLVLGRVIHALSEVGDSSGSTGSTVGNFGANGQFIGSVKVVPYRDSKLTRFLQDSLGGNSRTVMLGCISPSEIDLPETISTLRYASRARGIRNRAKVNLVVEPTVQLQQQMHQQQIIHKEKEAIAAATEARLTAEVESLREQVRAAVERAEAAEKEIEKLKGDMALTLQQAGRGVVMSASQDSLRTMRRETSRELGFHELSTISPISETPTAVESSSPIPPIDENPPSKQPQEDSFHLPMIKTDFSQNDDLDIDIDLFARYARLRDHVRQLKGLVGSALEVGKRGAGGEEVA